jgi:hypothetical protein
MAALLVVAMIRTMAPPRPLRCEKIHPFHLSSCEETTSAAAPGTKPHELSTQQTDDPQKIGGFAS